MTYHIKIQKMNQLQSFLIAEANDTPPENEENQNTVDSDNEQGILTNTNIFSYKFLL